MRMIPHDVENVNKETELIKKQNNKKTQIEIMYLKCVLTEKKFMRGATKADFFFLAKHKEQRYLVCRTSQWTLTVVRAGP